MRKNSVGMEKNLQGTKDQRQIKILLYLCHAISS